MTQRIFLFLLLPLLWLSQITAAADGNLQSIPALTSPITDTTGVLTAEERSALESRLLAFEQEKGSQIAILIVPTTQPEDIFSYSLRVAEQWKIGRKSIDDGVVFVVALQDRRTHIQVGYGLEGAIPDITAKRILQDIVAPYFQQGDFNGGINAAADSLMNAINGEELPAPTARASQSEGPNLGGALGIGLMVAFFARMILGRFLGGMAGGAASFATAMFIGAGLGLATIIGVFSTIALWVFLGKGVYAGGLGGGGLGGGGFGGGGFGGGGGSFGGGGASGSW